MHWIKYNSHRHGIPENTDHLHPSVIINNITDKDAGNYGVEVTVTSSADKWLNYSGHFAVDLVVDGNDTPCQVTVIIVLGVLLSIAIIAIIVYGLYRLWRVIKNRSNASQSQQIERSPSSVSEMELWHRH